MRKLRAGDAVNASLNFCLHSTEIKSLAEGVEVGGGEEGEDFNGLDGRTGGNQGQGANSNLVNNHNQKTSARSLDLLHSLIMHLSGLHMGRHRVGKVSQLPNVSGSVDVDTLGVVVKRRVGGGQAGWQSTVHSRVHQLCRLREEDLADVVQGKTRFLHRVRDSHSLEVAAVVHLTRLPVDERVVRR